MLIVHLSDIHFGKHEVGTAMDPNHHLRNELFRDVKVMCDKIGASPDAIIISGDIAYSAHPDEYKFAFDWLDKLCQSLGKNVSIVFTCPGNHDVTRSVTSRAVIQAVHKAIKHADDITLDATITGFLKDQETGKMLYESLAAYNNFAVQFFCDLLPPERTRVHRDLPLNDGSKLRLHSLNSTFVSSVADNEHRKLYLDVACFQITHESGVTHLVMCHHPYDWLRQGDQLKDHLSDVAQIHVFGHKHINRIDMNRDWVCLSAGAMHPDRQEPKWEPGYNLIELNVRGVGAERKLNIATHVRVWQTAPGQFNSKADRGSEVFRQTISLSYWEKPTPLEVKTETHEDDFNTQDIKSPKEGEIMNTFREITADFFRLTLSQKSLVAGKYNLLEDSDINLPDFQRFRNVLERAKSRGLIPQLEAELKNIRDNKATNAQE